MLLQTKHLLAAVCAWSLFLSVAQAQPKDSKRFEAIENEKIAYITKHLKLSPSEAERFFPLYNQYNREMWVVKSAKTGSSDKRDIISYDAKELDIKKAYRKKFGEAIGSSRASQFFEIEQNFRELLYKELQKRRR